MCDVQDLSQHRRVSLRAPEKRKSTQNVPAGSQLSLIIHKHSEHTHFESIQTYPCLDAGSGGGVPAAMLARVLSPGNCIFCLDTTS